MARTNTTQRTHTLPEVKTFEGGRAFETSPKVALRRAVLTCLLWERNFYEEGEDIAKRISGLVKEVLALPDGKQFIEQLAIEARNVHGLRHAPLWVANSLSDARQLSRHLVPQIVKRADELSELLAMYWSKESGGRRPLSNPMRYGLREAFKNFDTFQLARYRQVGDSPISLRDVMFLTHPKPTEGMVDTFAKLAAKELEAPDTWEVELSAGKDKKETFERLLRDKKIGALALLRNLRSMHQAGVSEDLVFERLAWVDHRARILPFQFVTAARHAPQWEPQIEGAMLRQITGLPKIPGKTILLVDVSASMDWKISTRSEMTRIDAAAGLAILAREMCERVAVFTFSNRLVQVPARSGFALRDAIMTSQGHNGTMLAKSLQGLSEIPGSKEADRIIVFTDEQSHDGGAAVPAKRGYMLDVAGHRNSVAFGKWVSVSGFSEACLNFIREVESVEHSEV